MKKVGYLFFATILCSCAVSQEKLDGTFENIDDHSRTIIKKLNEKEYQIQAEFNPSLQFTATRNANTLTANFQGIPITVEYNNSFDTIINKSHGRVLFIAKRVSDINKTK